MDKSPVLSSLQRLGDGSKERAIIVTEIRLVVLAAQDRHLVAQHNDLKILGPARPNGKHAIEATKRYKMRNTPTRIRPYLA